MEENTVNELKRIPVIKGLEEISPLKLLDGYAVTDSVSYLLHLSKTPFCSTFVCPYFHIDDAICEYFTMGALLSTILLMRKLFPPPYTANSPPYLFQLSEFVYRERQIEFVNTRLNYVDTAEQLNRDLQHMPDADIIFFTPTIASKPSSVKDRKSVV